MPQLSLFYNIIFNRVPYKKLYFFTTWSQRKPVFSIIEQHPFSNRAAVHEDFLELFIYTLSSHAVLLHLFIYFKKPANYYHLLFSMG